MSYEALITTRFTAESTALDVVDGVRLDGVRALVTGASSGLGVETARALVVAGAQVTLAVRDLAKGRQVAQEIDRTVGARTPAVLELDLASRTSVQRLVEEWRGPLHILIDNAGVVTSGLERTTEGWELQFATNHLGHVALTTGLSRALAEGAADRGEARVVALSSGAHMRSPVVFEDIQFHARDYDPQLAYAQSKTANVLFAVEATRRWSGEGIVANAVNPGGVRTGLQRNFSLKQRQSLDAAEEAGVFTYKTTQQGAGPPQGGPRAPPLGPPHWSPRSLPSSRTSGAATSTTGRRRRPSPTTPTWPTTPTPSRHGHLIPIQPNGSGPCLSNCWSSPPAPGAARE